MTMILDGTSGITFPDSSKQYNSYYGFKNRIINGAMVIDQRNAGASVTVNNNQQFPIDRFIVQSSTSTQFTAQQSTTAPTGFYNSLLITTSSANASGFNAVWQRIEANNTNDFGLGTASASTFTVSFWVRSSVTGTFGFYLQNSASTYSYVTTYTINTANTFEYKTITVTGPTAGTWLTTNNCSLQVAWSLGGTGGTTSTLGSWQSANVYNATGSTGISNTASATFYITGVQLEVGAVATSFDYRPIGTELGLCQRYFEQIGDVVGGIIAQALFVDSYSAGSSTSQFNWFYRQQKRAAPTIALYGSFTTSNVAGSVGTLGITPITACIYANPAAAGRLYWYNNAASGYSASAEL